MQSKPISVQMTDLTEELMGMSAEVKKEAGNAIAEAMLLMETSAKTNSPHQYGNLRAANRGLFDKEKMSGLLINDVNYAAYQNFGTGAMVKINQGWEAIASTFKGAGVVDLDMPGNNFFSNAYDRGAKELIETLTKIVENAKLTK